MSPSATRNSTWLLKNDFVLSNTGGGGSMEVSCAEYAHIETPISSPSNWVTWDEISDNQERNEMEEGCFSEEVPPFSSSPLNFAISTSCSSRSSRSSGTSLTSAHSEYSSTFSRNDTQASGTRRPDSFIRELQELLLRAQEDHEYVDRTNYSFYSDTSPVETPEFPPFFDIEGEGFKHHNSPSPKLNLAFTNFAQSPPQHSLESQAPECHQSDCCGSQSWSLGPPSGGTVSPITFEDPLHLVPLNDAVNKKNSAVYRIIKRARSRSGTETSQEDGVPPIKRMKTGENSSHHGRDRIYARRSASLRRADSLQAFNVNEQPTPCSLTTTQIPTTPLTPRPRVAELTAVQENISNPVPIIAPPSDHVPALPLSPEAVAKVRLMRLLEREASGRQAEGLSPGVCKRPPRWLHPETGDTNPTDIHGQSSIEDDIRFDWEVVMGLGSKRRSSIVGWILHVLPIRPLKALPSPSVSPSPPSSVLSSGSSAHTSSTESSQLEHGYNLLDELQHSPDTRFHAVWMFLRFFYLMMPHDTESNNEKAISPKSSSSHTSKALQQNGLALVAWDVAVACLSLSVKYHRDFLNPLLPVYAHEYLAIAPHTLTHEDLESAHRDVLSAFDYRLGITPQAVMDLLWLALPSLRSLLDFDGGWKKAQKATWICLFDFLRESDVQRFPISILATVSLMDSISDCLIHEYRRKSVCDDDPSCSPNDSLNFLDPDVLQAIEEDCQERVQEDTEGVFCDIQALVGLTDADLRDCRLWITHID